MFQELQPGLFFGGLMALASIIMLLSIFLQSEQRMTEEERADDKRICELINEATKRYPNLPALAAVMRYSADIETQIVTLRNNALTSDVVYALKSDLRDRTLLLQEIANWTRKEIENMSGFDVVTSARA